MQGDRADRGMLALMAVQPKQFPCSLDPSPASSSDASAEADNLGSSQLGELAFSLAFDADTCRGIAILGKRAAGSPETELWITPSGVLAFV